MFDAHIVNPEMIKMARSLLGGLRKRGFVGGGDPAMMDGGGGAPPPPGGGGDPMMGGGAPPMDPAMMGGGMPPMDPSMMGGMPPPPPPPGGGGGDPSVTAKLDQLIQLMQGGGVGGQSGANAAGQLKPKIDVNVEIMQIKHMLAKIIDAMGIPVQAQEMVATPEKLTQMAQQQQGTGQQDAAMGGGGGAIPPMGGMEGAGVPGMGMPKGAAAPHELGRSYRAASLEDNANKAAAIARFRRDARRTAHANGR